MTNIDWICVAVLSIFSFLGAKRGLIGEFFRIAAVIIGLLGGFVYYNTFANLLTNIFSHNFQSGFRIISFVIVFILFAGLVIFFGLVIKKIVRLTILGWIDKLGGLIIGATKGLFLIGFFLWLITIIPTMSSVINLDNTLIAGKTYKTISFIWEMAKNKNSDNIYKNIPAIPIGKMPIKSITDNSKLDSFVTKAKSAYNNIKDTDSSKITDIISSLMNKKEKTDSTISNDNKVTKKDSITNKNSTTIIDSVINNKTKKEEN